MTKKKTTLAIRRRGLCDQATPSTQHAIPGYKRRPRQKYEGSSGSDPRRFIKAKRGVTISVY